MDKSDYNKEIAKRLKQIRLEMRYTQEKFAEFLDISISSYKKIEKGTQGIGVDNLAKMKKKLKFTCDYLLFGEKANLDDILDQIASLDEADKRKLLLCLFAMIVSEDHDRNVALKGRDEQVLELVDELIGSLSKENDKKTTKAKRNKR